MSRPCGESARPGGSAPDSRDHVACTSVPVGGFRVMTCFAVSVSGVGLADGGWLDGLVLDRESGVDVDAELALGTILALAPGRPALREGQVVIPDPEAREAGARGDAGDHTGSRHGEPGRKRAVHDLVPDVRVPGDVQPEPSSDSISISYSTPTYPVGQRSSAPRPAFRDTRRYRPRSPRQTLRSRRLPRTAHDDESELQAHGAEW